MGRTESRQSRKDFKFAAKLVKNAVIKEHSKVIENMKQLTPQWRFLLTMTHDDLSQSDAMAMLTKVAAQRIANIDREIYREMYKEFLTPKLSSVESLLASIISTESENYSNESTVLVLMSLRLCEHLLTDTRLTTQQRHQIEFQYTDILKALIFESLMTLLPLTAFDKEDLTKTVNSTEAMLLMIKAWLVIKPMSLTFVRTKGWIDECDTLEEVLDYLEASDEIKEAILLLLGDDEEDLLDYQNNAIYCHQHIKKLIPLHRLSINALGAHRLATKADDDYEESGLPDFLKEMIMGQLSEALVGNLSDEEVYADLVQRAGFLESTTIFMYNSFISLVFMSKLESTIEGMEVDNEKMKTKLMKTENNLKTYKDNATSLQVKVNNLTKELNKVKSNHSLDKELEATRLELVSLRNQNEKLKAHIANLKASSEELQYIEEKIEITTPTSIEEVLTVRDETVDMEEILATISQFKLTVLGGPSKFSRRVKEFLPKATVIDGSSKFGEIRIGNSDYVAVYWKILGHARTMQLESQAKKAGAKIVHVDSTNKYLFCKQIFEQL